MPFNATFRRTDTGEFVERLFPTRAAVPEVLTAETDPQGELPDGVEAEHTPFVPPVRPTSGRMYPFVSHSIAVDRDRVAEARERTGCDFTRDGRLIVKSRADRLRACKALGYHEMS